MKGSLESSRTQKVIWLCEKGDESDFDKDYIEKVILSKIENKIIIYDGLHQENCDNSIVIVYFNKRIKDEKIERYLQRGKNVILIHLGGENPCNPDFMYRNAKIVIRAYYNPRYQHPHVYTIPLGFQSGMGLRADGEPYYQKKKYAWFFAGQIKSDRAVMLEAFEKISPRFLHVTKKWNCGTAISAEEVSKLMQQSIFVPCPLGWINQDSYRVMEALENGAIPVTKLFYGIDYFRYNFGDHPLIVGKSWEDCAEIVLQWLKNPEKLADYVETVKKWYQEFRLRLSADVSAIINGGKPSMESKQFIYQQEIYQPFYLKSIFCYHFKIRTKLLSITEKFK
jgi:hypothetical protein